MVIIGLNHGEINSSAAVYKDGRIIAGAPEERFNRVKRSRDFPRSAMEYCLQAAGTGMDGVDCIAQAWNPGAAWVAFNPLLSRHRVKREDYFYTIPDHLFNFVPRKPGDWVQMAHDPNTGLPPLYYVQHHRTHAANALFLSPFEEAAIATCDWRGEFECLTLGHGRGNSIDTFRVQHVPHSLGMFYATYTELLGYEPDGDEWKVMALSAFDVDCADMVRRIRGTLELTPDGLLKLDQSFYKGAVVDQPHLYTPELVELLGGKVGVKGADPDDWTINVAKAMQIISEEIANGFLSALWQHTRCDNLALSGGFFMNCVYNGKVLDETPFKNVYISYAPSDVGNSIGAALYVAHCLKDCEREYGFNDSYIGPSFSDDQIEKALNRRSINYQVLEEPEKQVAQILADGHIVAHFDGRMEFGERALGNRSILGDPRREDMKDKINAVIKYRESYRPFAPATLAERTSEFFDVHSGYDCHYMEKVVPVAKQYRDQLPAITHVDGSARLQTVEKEHNRRFYNIIAEFEKLTGFPVVLNTSFNINGEPIVLSPDDALSTFFNSGLTRLVLGKYLVCK